MEGQIETQKAGISGFTLKMIALITMFLDHFGAAVVERALQNPLPFMGSGIRGWYYFYIALRGIGRMAFPIYCFLLVEGFHYTHSRAKYALRLLIFALLSDLPFDLAFNKSWFDFDSNNVFWTLLIGLLVIWGCDFIWKKVGPGKSEARPGAGWIILRAFLCLLILAAGMAVAEYVLHTDYGAAGIITIFAMYVFSFQHILAYGIGVAVLTAFCYSSSQLTESLSILMILPISFYHGKKGPKMNKYFFYGFYPVHLLLLVGLCLLLGLPVL